MTKDRLKEYDSQIVTVRNRMTEYIDGMRVKGWDPDSHESGDIHAIIMACNLIGEAHWIIRSRLAAHAILNTKGSDTNGQEMGSGQQDVHQGRTDSQ